MTTLEKKPEGYITLKEASELFGYSPDYIGQLIRKGKIEGKRVYANVAWMTTKNTLDEYLARERGAPTKNEETSFVQQLMRLFVSEQSMFFATWFLRALIPVLVAALLVIFYFVSISIDHKLTKSTQHELEARNMVAGIGVALPSEGAFFTYEK